VTVGRFRLFSPGWWVLHVLAVALFFFLGHAVRF
jgi:hypothetical protein